ncbi:MAG TPA: hypothetical protein VD927_06330 [Chryseosolibacter sp.]|nr:hypothetical protein [Chryseosolibacter sp.]
MAKGKTQKHYDKSPASRAVKAEYQKKFNAKPENRRRRAELNKYNREAQESGRAKVGDKKDASHKGGRIVGFEDQKTNRGRKEKSRRTGSKRC